MCKSLAEGGQRCAAHTRGPAKNAMWLLRYHPAEKVNDKEFDALVAYASTPSSKLDLKWEIEHHEKEGQIEKAELLRNAVTKGEIMREVNREAAAKIKAAITKEQIAAAELEADAELDRRYRKKLELKNPAASLDRFVEKNGEGSEWAYVYNDPYGENLYENGYFATTVEDVAYIDIDEGPAMEDVEETFEVHALLEQVPGHPDVWVTPVDGGEALAVVRRDGMNTVAKYVSDPELMQEFDNEPDYYKVLARGDGWAVYDNFPADDDYDPYDAGQMENGEATETFMQAPFVDKAISKFGFEFEELDEVRLEVNGFRTEVPHRRPTMSVLVRKKFEREREIENPMDDWKYARDMRDGY